MIYDASGQVVGVADPDNVLPATDAAIAKLAAQGMLIVDRGPVNLGGTTGLGMPRNSPQRALPGDVPGRQIIKTIRRPGR